MAAAASLQTPSNEYVTAAVASAGNHDNNIYNNGWAERYHGMKEVAVTAETDTTKTVQTGTTDNTNRTRGTGSRQRRVGSEDDGGAEDNVKKDETQKKEEGTKTEVKDAKTEMRY